PIDRKAPKAGALFRIAEDGNMIQTRDGADDVSTALIAGNKVQVALIVPSREKEVVTDLHHIALCIAAVDRIRIRGVFQRPDEKGTFLLLWQIVLEIKAIGVRRI